VKFESFLPWSVFEHIGATFWCIFKCDASSDLGFNEAQYKFVVAVSIFIGR
jgi:hypothetical protein